MKGSLAGLWRPKSSTTNFDSTGNSFKIDCIIFTSDIPSHLAALEKLLRGYSEANLRISPVKSKIFRTKIKFLGHLISQDGLSVDPDYVKVIKDWKLPNTRKLTRGFLGKIGYYRSTLVITILSKWQALVGQTNLTILSYKVCKSKSARLAI